MRRFERIRYRHIGKLDAILRATTITPCHFYDVHGDGIMGQERGKGRRCFCDRMWISDRAVYKGKKGHMVAQGTCILEDSWGWMTSMTCQVFYPYHD